MTIHSRATAVPDTSAAIPDSPPALAASNLRRWAIVWLLFAASVINYFDRQTLSYALPVLASDFHLDPLQQGVLSSAFFWSYALMQIPMGLLADRANLRWLYAGTFALWSLAQGLTGFAGSFAALIGCRLLLGIGEAVYLVGGTKVVSLFFPLSQRGLPCGLFDAGTRTGLVIEGLTIGWLLQTLGWRKTFMAVGFAALVWLLPWLLATPLQMRETTAAPKHEPARMPWAQVGTLLWTRGFLGVLMGFFWFDYFWYFLITWLPSYLVSVRKLTILRAGIYASIPFLVFGVCQPLGGWIADRMIRKGSDPGRTRKAIISIAFLSGLLIIPAARVTRADTALLLLAGGCLVGLSTANQLVLLQAYAPRGRVGLAVGVYNFVGNLAGILAPIVTGFVIQVTGSYTPAFVLAAVALALSQFAYWFVVGPIPSRQ